ncbi:MAG: hypothetical protein HZB25_09150 [Candidatus Eisenbacteria bacterium]|nr:hypothetical protein [Candidatus Eisenbacteria bacterium]
MEPTQSPESVAAANLNTLVGGYDQVLDAKARVNLPIAHRLIMRVQPGNDVLLTIGAEGCLQLGDADGEWALDFLSKLRQLDWTRANDRALLRDLAPRTFRVKIDSEGRVNIPPVLVQWAGLKPGTKVRCQGAGRNVEIWNIGRVEALPTRGASFEDRLEKRFGQGAEGQPAGENG